MKNSNKKESPSQLSLLEDFPAKIYPLQEKGKESLEKDQVFGRSLRGSSKMYSRSGRLLKMYQPLDLKDLPWSYKISARSGTMRSGIAFPVVQLVGYTEEIAYGSSQDLWRTPDAHCDRGAVSEERMQKKLDENLPISLNDQVAHRDMWATPNTLDHLPPRSKEAMERNFAGPRKGRTKPSNLREQVHPDMWPTPTTQDAGKATKRWREDRQNNLTAAVFNPDHWPTPSSRDYKGGYLGGRIRNGKPSMDTLDVAVQYTDNQEKDKKKGQLNPEWVQRLLGYPVDYTLVED